VAQKRRRSFQGGRVDDRPDRPGSDLTIVYRVRDASTQSGWRLKRETLKGVKRIKEAESILTDRIGEVNKYNNGEPTELAKAEALQPKSDALTFKQFAEGPLWASHLKKPDKQGKKRSPSTHDSYTSMVQKRILPALGNLPLNEITSESLTLFFAALDAEGCSPKYLTNVYSLVADLFDVAHLNGKIPASPVSRKLHRWGYERVEKPVMSRDVLRGIVANSPAEYKVLFAIAIATGVRQGELIGFLWSDFDSETHTLTVTGSVYRGRRKPPKSKAGVRSLDLTSGLVKALEYQRNQSEFTRPGDYIFAQKDGRPQSPDHLRRQVLYPILDTMGVERLDRAHGFHAFRHSAGAALYKATRDPKLVQGHLGHSNVQTTLDIYVHLDAEQREQGTAILVQEKIGRAHV